MVTEGRKKGQMTEKKHKLVQKVEKQLNLTGFHWIPMDSPDSPDSTDSPRFPRIPTSSFPCLKYKLHIPPNPEIYHLITRRQIGNQSHGNFNPICF